MNIPKLDIPEAQKTQDWIKKVGYSIIGLSKTGAFDKRTDQICWNMYNKIFNKHDYGYLYKEGDNVLPAKIRMLGYQRSYCNVLISQQARRPFPFSVVTVDTDSIEKKHEKKIRMIVEKSIAEMKGVYYQTMASRKKLQQEREKIMQIISQEPENEEMAAMQSQIQEVLPDIESTFEIMDDQLQRAGSLTKEELDKIEHYARYDMLDRAEEIAIAFLKKAETEDRVKKAATDAFRRQVVTGKHYYYVDITPGKRSPIFKVLDEQKVYYPRSVDVEFTHELPWFSINESISYNDLLNIYGHKLSEKERASIKESINYQQGQFASVPPSGAIDRSELEPQSMYNGSASDTSGVSLWRIFFKAPRKIHVKYTKNKHKEDDYFRHIVTEEDIEAETKRASKRPDVRLETRYIDDLYEVIMTENGTFLEGYKRNDAVRDIETPSNVFIPVFGRVYGGSEQPYSLIWATRDIEILIAIITFYKELLIATAGVKGQIVDLSHKPDDMSMEEQAYHRKKGSLYIQTVKKGGQRVNPSFNQWREFDDTISPSVQYLDQMIDHLDKTMGRIMGINYQRLGERQTGDQVGTYQMAAEQSVLVTEIIYDDFDEVLREALTHYVRIMSKYTFAKGGYVSYNHMSEGSKILKIPEKLLDGVDLKVILANNLKNEADLRELKQHAYRFHEKGMLPFHQLVSIHGIQNVKTLEKKLEYFSKQAEQIAQEQQQGAMQEQERVQKELLQFKAQLDGELEKQRQQVQQMALQLEAEKAKFEQYLSEQELKLQSQKVQGDHALKAMEIESENTIEAAYLEEMGRSAQVNERLRAIEIQVEAIINSYNLGLTKNKLILDGEKETNRHSEAIKKITTSKTGSIPRISRNHIKD